MITDLQLAQAALDAYSKPASLPIPETGTDVRITIVDEAMLVSFRGSKTLQDWIRDFRFAPIVLRAHPQLGPCHDGFLRGVESVIGPILNATIGKKVYIDGHSLGGALAVGTAALFTLAGRPVETVVTFGAPRFGMAPFVSLLKPVTVRQYRNGNDPVPDLPLSVAPEFLFLDSRDPRIVIGAPCLIDVECHLMANYMAAMTAFVAKTPEKESA